MKTTKKIDMTSYSLFIHPKDVQELRADVWCDDPVPAKLKVGKQQYEIDIAYRGSLIREFPKKSYHIQFYQPRLFHGAHEFHLNAEYLDPSMMRNKLSLDFFRTLGALTPEARFVTLKLNGAGQGVYLQLESVDQHFLQKRGLPLGAIHYAVDDDANFSLLSPRKNDVKTALDNGYERKLGTDDDDVKLCELIYLINTIPRKDFEKEIVKYVNVDNYLLWLTGAVCTQNFDAFIHNYALYRNGETGRYEIIPWDYDATFGRDCKMKIMEYDYIPIRGYNTLTARILDVPTFRRQYKQLMEQTLETHFTLEAFAPQFSAFERLLRPQLLLDPYKRESISKFDRELELMLQFVLDRNQYLREHLCDLD
jgi:spore coat protein H